MTAFDHLRDEFISYLERAKDRPLRLHSFFNSGPTLHCGSDNITTETMAGLEAEITKIDRMISRLRA